MLVPGEVVGKGNAQKEFLAAFSEKDLDLIWPSVRPAGILRIFQKLGVNNKEVHLLLKEKMSSSGQKMICGTVGVRTEDILLAIDIAKKEIDEKKKILWQARADEEARKALVAQDAEKQKEIMADNFRRSRVFNPQITVPVGLTTHAKERFCERFMNMSWRDAERKYGTLEVFRRISESFAGARKIKISQRDLHFKFLRYGIAEYFWDPKERALFTLSPESKPVILTITRRRSESGGSDSTVPEMHSADPLRVWHRGYLDYRKGDK